MSLHRSSLLKMSQAELDDLDVITGGGEEFSSELTGEPARLQLELARSAKRKEKCPLMNAGGAQHGRVAIGTGGHLLIVAVSLGIPRAKIHGCCVAYRTTAFLTTKS